MRSSSRPRSGPGPEIVSARELRAGYGRGIRHLALRGFNAEVGPGITGLVGPNGAGKTTLLRILAGVLRPLSGQVEVLGGPPESQRTRGRIGYLTEIPPLPHYLTAEEFLSGLPTPEALEVPAGSPMPEPTLPPNLRGRSIGSLSLGQRKRVALTAALSGDPDLLLLDEPTNGLDPLALRWLREVLLGLKKSGKSILISSHHLDELQRLADVLIFVRNGKSTGSWSRWEVFRDFPSLEALFESQIPGEEP